MTETRGNALWSHMSFEPRTRKDYGSAKAYADAVRTWYVASFNWLQCQHQSFVQNSSTTQLSFPQHQTTTSGVAHVRRRGPLVHRVFQFVIRPQQDQSVILQRCFFASFPKRIIAELVDFFSLLVLKVVMVYMLLELDAIYLEDMFNNTADLQTLIDLTRGLFHVELISKFFSSILEALCISYGFMSTPRGCTPGKYLLGLEVVQYVDIQPVPETPYCVQIARNPSLIRSLIKNMVTNFFFPINAFCYGFNFNQAIYDCAAKTIVIERR